MFEICLGLLVFFALVFLGQEIFVCMAAAVITMVLVLNLGADTFVIIPQTMLFGVEALELAAIPLFILAGELMNTGGMTIRLVTFSRTLVGHIRGGLSMVAVVVNMIMAGVSGSAVADASSTAAVLIPAMKEDGYDVDYAAALIASAATIGPIIPPSIPMIVFAVSAEASIGRLFLGGTIPGILMGLALMATCYYIARRHNYRKLPRATLRETLRATKDAFFALSMPLFVLVSVVFGIATVTEVAGIAAAYSAIVGLFIFKELKFGDLPRIVSETAVMSATVLITLATASSFAWLMTTCQIGAKLVSILAPISQNPVLILLMINLVFLLIGCVFEPLPAIVIFVPILMPLVKSVGIDVTHFGVIIVFNLMLGLLTPTVGLNLFITAAIAKRPTEGIVRIIWPFFLTLLVVLLLCSVVPPLVTFLPNSLMR